MEKLFEWENPPHRKRSVTSRAAAASVAMKAPSQRERVLQVLKCEALTDEQIAERLGMRPNTARPRRIELVRCGEVVEIGRAMTSSGRYASVWKAA